MGSFPSRGFLRFVVIALAVCTGTVMTSFVAQARTINLGGERGDHGYRRPGNEMPFRVPSGTVQLPTMIAPVLQVSDHRWRMVHVDAYLAPDDGMTAHAMEILKKVIAAQAVRELPANSYETMLSPYSGPQRAKDTIRAAAEHALGHPWEGEVYIRSLMVY